MSAFDQLVQAAMPAFESAFGVPVTYRRADATVSLADVPVASTTWETRDEYGASLLVETRDYLIHRADLTMDGAAILPQRGDRIEETVHGETRIFEVLSPAGQRHYRFEDASQTVLRVYTKHIATTATSGS